MKYHAEIWYPGGGHLSKFRQGCSSYFLGLKFSQVLFSGLANSLAIFLGFTKFLLFFLSLTNFQLFFGSSNFCITHLNPLNGAHSTEKHKIIVAFHIYSSFDKHCILSHSIFGGLDLESFYFFGWLKFVLRRVSLSKKRLCAPPPGFGIQRSLVMPIFIVVRNSKKELTK